MRDINETRLQSPIPDHHLSKSAAMSDSQPMPPLRVTPTFTKSATENKAVNTLEQFLSDYEARVLGESTVGVQLRKLQAALREEQSNR